MNVYDKAYLCANELKSKLDIIPDTAVILGSSMGGFVSNMHIISSVEFSELEGFPIATVKGHQGRFVLGKIWDRFVIAVQGRIHYYEGYDISDVVLPVRVLGLIGVKNIILTNAAGGINTAFNKEDIMLVTDHVSCFVPSPLRGENYEKFGCRFPDMTQVYDLSMCNTVRKCAKKLGISLKEGVYVQLSGPNYETPAEIRMLSSFGDAVGMSTAVEAMAAKHMGINVCALSHITNMAAGIENDALMHENVTKCNADMLCKLLTEIIKER